MALRLAAFTSLRVITSGGNCSTTPGVYPGTATGTITQPSGLVGTFTVSIVPHGRSYVPHDCQGIPPGGTAASDGYPVIPDAWSSFTITQRAVSGAGVPTEIWKYDYSAANASWSDCTGSCPTTIYTDVVNPDASSERYTFSNKFDYTESKLLRTDYYAGAVGSSTLLRSEINSYAPPTTAPLPAQAGGNPQAYVNTQQTDEYSPLEQRDLTQDGDTYTWQAEAFNEYAQVTQTKRSNSIAGQTPIEESTSYLNDTNLWVLGLPVQVTNLSNNGEVESLNTYNPLDELTARARFGQTLMHYTWNAAGQLASFEDGDSHITTLGNYKRGIPQAIGYPDNTSESLVVDDVGQISSVTDQAGHTTRYTYDPVGRVASISYPTGDETVWDPTIFTYTYAGTERGLSGPHWRRKVTTGNAVATTTFDAELRPVLSDSAIGSTLQASTLTTYDTKGQKVFSAYPSGTALAFTSTPVTADIPGVATKYDALERPVETDQDSELGTLTTKTQYLSGARVQVTDPKHNVTTTSYQVFDQPSDSSVIKVQAPAGVTQTITRDLYGHPQTITQAGLYNGQNVSLTKHFTYDSYYRLCRTSEPESHSTVMGYDGANNLLWSAQGLIFPNSSTCDQDQVPAAAKTVRTYDPMNRVQTIVPPAGTQSTHYYYTALGQPYEVDTYTSTGNDNAWGGDYNFRGMLIGESLQVAGYEAWGIGYSHDANGHLSLVHYPDGENISYAPDALGRPTQAGSYASGVTYYADGQVSGFLYGNGAGYVAGQNTRNLIDTFSVGTSANAGELSEDLLYDADANITQIKDLTGGPRNKTFGYDALNRLTNAVGMWGTQTYQYDPLNNLRTLQTGSQVSIYNYDPSNLLSSITSGTSTLASYQYDTRGNVISKNTTNLVFDQKDQLAQIVGADTYAYDAAGRRVMKTPAGGSPTFYFYSQAGQLMYQWSPSLGQSTDFIYLGSKLVGDNESVALTAPPAISFDTNPSNGSVTVSWGAVPSATSYILQEQTNGGAWTTVYSGSATRITLNNLVGGSDVYQVEGCIGGTCGHWTFSATLGVSPALPTVTVPSGTINGTYTVSWTAPVGATAYTVQESLNGGAWATIASNTAATSISRPGTTSGSYTYRVSASNASGTRGWVASSAVKVDITYGVVPTEPASLIVPTSSSTGSAALSWSAATLVTNYVLQQSSNGGSSWSTVYTGGGTSTTLSGLPDASDVYRVQACNTYGCSAWRAGSATLVVGHVPVAPASITVPATSSGSLTVSWAGSAYATSYTLQQRVGAGAWSTVYTGGALSLPLSETTSGSYTYQVKATSSYGSSAYRVSSAVTVTLPPTAAPTVSVPASSSTGSYTVSWGAVTAATSYTLQEQVNGGSWATIQTSNALSRAFSGKGGATYSYRVQACNAGGCAPWSGTKSIVVLPLAPSGLTATIDVINLSTGALQATGTIAPLARQYAYELSASWSASAGATSYTFQYCNSSGTCTTSAGSATSASGISVIGTAYTVSVKACDASGCSAYSAAVTPTVVQD